MKPGAERAAPARLTPHRRQTIRRRLLTWYDRYQRDLPWRRRPKNAYAQWVAEIMLQQTRVETVRDYYTRFMKRFPTIRDLGAAPHDAVLKQWEGLGYYRRALNLHRAARRLRDQRRPIPTTADELRELPGLGEYTSNAIAAIAFGERRAAVDGNVARVVARLFAVELDILSTDGKRMITVLAQELIPRGRPGDFNQAWMDLGSAVCTPRSPNCPACPLRRGCAAYATNRTDELPRRDGGRKGRGTPRLDLLTVVFVSEGRILLQRRPKGGLWSGLWEFPTIERTGQNGDAQAIDTLSAESRVVVSHAPSKAGTVRHKLTHRDLHFTVYVAATAVNASRATTANRRWATPRQLDRLSVSTAHRRIHEAALPVLDCR